MRLKILQAVSLKLRMVKQPLYFVLGDYYLATFFELNGSEGYINVDGRFDTHGGDKIFWSTKKDKKFLVKI